MSDVINKDCAVWDSYRVWMKDGHAFRLLSKSESEAMKDAVKLAKASIKGIALSAAEKRQAVQVDYVVRL